MSKFKVGDKVVVINVDSYSNIMKHLVGEELIVRSVGNDKCGCEIVYAGIPGVEGWFLRSDDLRLISETQTESADQAPAEVPEPKHSKQFKVGDYVVVIGGHNKSDQVHIVTDSGFSVYPLEVNFLTYTTEGRLVTTDENVCLRHATPEEIAASKKPKPLRRGDLVLYREQLGIIHNIDSDGYWVAALTGDGCCVHKNAKDLMRIGSVRKKIKRIKKGMEGGK